MGPSDVESLVKGRRSDCPLRRAVYRTWLPERPSRVKGKIAGLARNWSYCARGRVKTNLLKSV
jgi:hypothetical protein